MGLGLAMLAFAGYSVVTASGPKTTAALANAEAAAGRVLSDPRSHPIIITHPGTASQTARTGTASPEADTSVRAASIPAAPPTGLGPAVEPRLAPPTSTLADAGVAQRKDGFAVTAGMHVVSLERGGRITRQAASGAALPMLTAKAGRVKSMASAGAFEVAGTHSAREAGEFGQPGTVMAKLLPMKKLGEAEFSRQAAAAAGLAQTADRETGRNARATQVAALQTDASDAGLASSAPSASAAAIPLPGDRPDAPAPRELAMADPAEGGTAALEARFGAVLRTPEASGPDDTADAGADDPAAELGSVPLPTSRPKVATPTTPAPAPAAAREVARTKPADAEAVVADAPAKPDRPKRRAPWNLLAYAPTVDPDMENDAPRVGRVALPGRGSGIAVYDIDAATVYMPNGERLEAHSGLGYMVDEPRYVKAKNRGPTPPNVYNLRMRESLFHGVEAIRLLPADGRNKFNRDGLLAHSYMLRGRGQSNGCVVFANYPRFLKAFKRGEVRRMIVVARMSDLPRQLASLD